MLRDRLASMKVLVAEAQPLVPGAVRAFREKLAAKIKEAGGLTIALDPATAEYPVMPLAAIDSGALRTRSCQ